MKVNVWGINYWPELTGIAVYNTDLCDFLASQGCSVDMVTAFPYYPFWCKKPDDGYTLFRTENLGLVRVRRCWQYVPSKLSTYSRILHEATFVLTSAFRQLTLPKPDVYVVVSPPLLLGFAAWVISRVKGAPFHFHVQDLQPDAAYALNMLENKLLFRFLFAMEKLAYEKAASVSAISAQMCEAIASKGVDRSKILPFPNWVELPDSASMPRPGSWKEKRGLDDSKLIVSYSGSLGIKQGLELILETAKVLKDNSSVLFVIAGDGALRKQLERMKQENDLDNVILESVLPEDEHSALLVDSSICLITQKPDSGALFLPSKLLKILAFERPIITNAEPSSALSQAVSEGNFGITIARSSPEEFARAIVDLLADQAARKRLGEAGRAFVTRFDKDLVLPQFKQQMAALAEVKVSRLR